MTLAFQAYMSQREGTWGGITGLARAHQVSRTFIYDLLATFKASSRTLFFPPENTEPLSEEALEARMLSYRFEGRCSIASISTLMKRDGLAFSSQGAISERLTRIGQALPSTLSTPGEATQLVIFANDEVYAKAQPILITVEPISSAILRIELADNRTAAQWCEHYKELLAHGFQPLQMTSDAGVGITAANAATFPDIPWQLDTFHSVAHRLGDWDRRFARRIDSAISYAADREAKLESAKSEAVIDRRLTQCFEADRAIARASQLHGHFRYLYREIIQQLDTFDSAGKLRQRHHAEDTIAVALDLMEELGCKALNKAIASVRKAFPHCLNYFEAAKKAVQQCEKLTNHSDVLPALCLAWQWDKTCTKSKQTERRHHAIKQRDFYLEWVRLIIDDEQKAGRLKEVVYREPDQIIQASSMVECINSLLRPYLNNSKNQLTQAFLNTFMFYHNHRRYQAGKRKGQTPLEILTGEPQKEDWIVLVQKVLRQNEASLAA